jgi:pimeloyl-ACP methyl ester carboxylesterase
MPRALANGIQIHYERQGDSGEPLVLVHGYTGDMTDWQDQAREFSRDYSVITLDLRGHGNSEAPERSNYSIEIMARDVESLVDVLGLEKYHLVGHSLGGCIVQEVALSTPKRLLSLTLEDTGPLGAAPADTEMEKFNALQIELAETKGMGAVVELRRQYLDRLPVPVPDDILESAFERLEKMSVEGFIGATLQGPRWVGTIDRAASITAPTLVICGELDAAPMVFASQWLAQTIPNARLEMIPEAGHSPQREQAQVYNKVLRRHLEEHHA